MSILVLACVAIAWAVRPSKTTTYHLRFENAGQLVKGDLVRVGGTPAGKIGAIELAADGRADVEISLKDSYAPLHTGTLATIRAPGLTGVASRYVSLQPGSTTNGTLTDGATIDASRTTSIVDIDQLFDSLDATSRKGLRGVVKGFATWYAGRESEAGASADELPRTLHALRGVAQDITADTPAFERLVTSTAGTMGALAERAPRLDAAVTHAAGAAAALGGDAHRLSDALHGLPPAVREGSRTLRDLRPALGDLRRLTDRAGPATRDLVPFLERLNPVLDEGVPVFAQLRRTFASPGDHDDLLDALRDLPRLSSTVTRDFPQARRALADSTPIFSFARPYVPDLVAWVRGFGAVMAPYDASGHYARGLPVFDAFEDRGGTLSPKPPELRGSSADLSYGNLRRCPGSAARIDDGSAPFRDDGPLARPDCDPGERPGSAR